MSRDEGIAGLGYVPETQPHEAVSACNLCGGERHVEVARRERYGYPVTLRVCATCGLGFLSPRPTATAYAVFIRDVYRPLVSAYHGRRIRDRAGRAAQLRGRARGVASARAKRRRAACSTSAAPRAWWRPGSPAPADADRARSRAGRARGGGGRGHGGRRGLRGGLRAGRAALGPRPALPDDRPPARRDRDALHPARPARAGRPRVRRILDVNWVLARQGTIEGAYKIDHPYCFTRATAFILFARCGFDVVAERMADDGHSGFLLGPGGRKNLQSSAAARSSGGAFETALAADCFAEVALSSDDPAILAEADGLPATALARPPALASDTATTLDVVLHVLDVLSQSFDAVATVQCTSPFTAPDDLAGAVAILRETGAGSVVTVPRGGGSAAPAQAQAARARPPAPMARGRPDAAVARAARAVRAQRLGRSDAQRGPAGPDDQRGYVMPPDRSFDIDTEATCAGPISARRCPLACRDR